MVLKCGLKADSNNGYFSEFSVYEGRTESALTSQNTHDMCLSKTQERLSSLMIFRSLQTPRY